MLQIPMVSHDFPEFLEMSQKPMPKHANPREHIQQGFFDVYALLMAMGHALGWA